VIPTGYNGPPTTDNRPEPARVASAARQAALVTIRRFENAGVLDDPQIGDAFRACDLAD
jgi:hypothetical protein